MTTTLLSGKERHQLLRVLRELDPSSPGEKRCHPRRKVLKGLWIRNLTASAHSPLRKAILENVSTQGVGLLLHRPLKNGDKFLLPLDFEDGSGWLVLCEARNARRIGSGQFKVGARFIDRVDRQGTSFHVPGDWLMN